jgi:hypothetical protein
MTDDLEARRQRKALEESEEMEAIALVSIGGKVFQLLHSEAIEARPGAPAA